MHQKQKEEDCGAAGLDYGRESLNPVFERYWER